MAGLNRVPVIHIEVGISPRRSATDLGVCRDRAFYSIDDHYFASLVTLTVGLLGSSFLASK